MGGMSYDFTVFMQVAHHFFSTRRLHRSPSKLVCSPPSCFLLSFFLSACAEANDVDQPHAHYATRSGGRARPGYASLFFDSDDESDVRKYSVNCLKNQPHNGP